MNTLQAVKANKFACFDHLASDVKTEQMRAITYIERMAGISATDLSSVDLFDIFGAKGADKAVLVTSKGEINRRIFALSQAPKKKPTESSIAANSHAAKKLQAVFARSQEQRITRLKETHRDRIRRIRDYQVNIDAHRKEAWDMLVSIQALETQSVPDISSQIDKIANSDFWEFLRIKPNGAIAFKNRSDIVLTEKNLRAGLDIQVNMGRFEASFHPRDGWVRVNPLERNPIVQNAYFHPFVSGVNGSICFGNAAETADRLLENMEIYEYFMLLATLLSSYEAGVNPYVSLQNFNSAAKAGAYTLSKPCRNCGMPAGHSCPCHYCEVCERGFRYKCETHYCHTCKVYRADPGDGECKCSTLEEGEQAEEAEEVSTACEECGTEDSEHGEGCSYSEGV